MIVTGKHVYLYKINQSWFGHLALKPTLIYIVSKEKISAKITPKIIAVSSYNDNDNNKIRKLESLSHKQREETPIKFAEFLVSIARHC